MEGVRDWGIVGIVKKDKHQLLQPNFSTRWSIMAIKTIIVHLLRVIFGNWTSRQSAGALGPFFENKQTKKVTKQSQQKHVIRPFRAKFI